MTMLNTWKPVSLFSEMTVERNCVGNLKMRGHLRYPDKVNLTGGVFTLYSGNMENVTVTLEEDVARWARVWAAEHDTSVSRILGDTLKEKMQKEGNYARAQTCFFSRQAKPLKQPKQNYPKRDELYEC